MIFNGSTSVSLLGSSFKDERSNKTILSMLNDLNYVFYIRLRQKFECYTSNMVYKQYIVFIILHIHASYDLFYWG